MKILRVAIIVILLALIGGFVFLSTTDIPVERTEVRKTIPNDRFFKD